MLVTPLLNGWIDLEEILCAYLRVFRWFQSTPIIDPDILEKTGTIVTLWYDEPILITLETGRTMSRSILNLLLYYRKSMSSLLLGNYW